MGKVYQLTAIDVFTRWAFVAIVLGPVHRDPHGRASSTRCCGTTGATASGCRAVLTDNGPEYMATGFRAHLVAKGLTHQRIPPRSPNHNAVCERFHGTILQECWRPAFHRRRFTSIRQLQAEADAWLVTYNHRRKNHGDYMRGRTPTGRPRQLQAEQSSMTIHHQPQRPSVTSTLGPEALVDPRAYIRATMANRKRSGVVCQPHGTS